MKILKTLGVILLAVIVILLGLILTQPAKGHVEKSVVIHAPASAIFPHLNNLEKFVAWSPWSKMDPTVKNVFEEPAAGVGAKMHWDGPETGKGSQWIIESIENERVKTGLKFDGFDGESMAEFTLRPEESGTKVTWTYDGPDNGFMGKAIWLMMGSMLDSQYQDGLNDLKKLIESQPATEPIATTPADSTVSK